MKLGILGLPAAGKSTLFDLLAAHFEGPDYSLDPTKPRVRTVKVRDRRLERLRDDYEPRKFTPAAFELYDFPAASAHGERGGLADLLAPARELDALLIVVRAFDAPGAAAPDPLRDLEEVRGEFLLADLVIVERRLERLAEKSRKPTFTDDDRKEQALLGRIQSELEADRSISSLDLSADDRRRLSCFGFLSGKPLVVVASTPDGRTEVDSAALGGAAGSEVIALSALNEYEILQLAEEERDEFLREYGIEELRHEEVVSAGYRAAGRISFFTAGEKEVRAWTIRAGESAVEAAGQIHTDIQRGFIRAETVGWEDYEQLGSVQRAKEKGVFRLEGKEYVVQDGDIIEFRFSV